MPANDKARKLLKHDHSRTFPQTPLASTVPTTMPLLRPDIPLLLALPLWIRDLPGMHAGECLGHVVQSHHLAVSRLRRTQRLRQSI